MANATDSFTPPTIIPLGRVKDTLVTMPKALAQLIFNGRPGDVIARDTFGASDLAKNGPPGVLVENPDGTFTIGEEATRTVVVLRFDKSKLPGELHQGLVSFEVAPSKNLSYLHSADDPLYISLAEWNLISIPIIYVKAVMLRTWEQEADALGLPFGTPGPHASFWT